MQPGMTGYFGRIGCYQQKPVASSSTGEETGKREEKKTGRFHISNAMNLEIWGKGQGGPHFVSTTGISNTLLMVSDFFPHLYY